MPRKSARSRSSSWSGARSCRVTTSDSAAPSAEWIGVALTSIVMLRPSGTESTTSSARTVAAPPITCFMGNSARATSRPSEKRHVTTSSNCSRGWPGVRNPSTIRLASRFERQRIAGLGVEHDDTDRRSLHQGLEVGSRPLLGAVDAGVGDRGRRLRGEQDQDLLVVGRELLSALLLSEKESADVHAPVTHRRRLQGLRQHQVRGVAERADVGGEVPEPERPGKVAEVFEQAQPVRPVQQLPLLFRGEAGSDEFLRLARLVDRRDEAKARAGQGARGIDDLAQDRAHVEARADAQDGGAQAGAALPQDLDFPRLLVALLHRSSLSGSRAKPDSPSGADGPAGRDGTAG